MNFGAFVKNKRLEKKLGLRRFCLLTNQDPGTWSRVERSLEAPTQKRSRLEVIADALNLSGTEREDFFTMANLAAGRIPEEIIENENLMEVLPAFFRTVNSIKPSNQELRHYVKSLLNHDSRSHNL